MTHNQIATILEIISFFCVTIDLFGQERIIKFGRKLHDFADHVRNLEIQKSFWRVFRNWYGYTEDNQKTSSEQISIKEPSEDLPPWFYILFYLIMCPICTYVLPLTWQRYLWFSWFTGETSNPMINILIRILFTFFFGMVLAGLLSILVLWLLGAIITVLEFIIDLILGAATFLLARMNLEGVLLAVGTILFLISKIVTFPDI
ncbi:MAG: hypothetical protein KDJ97_10530 [Anaerolineae bacterium]|nr:hypothetical protein [Anaerolineae bacterium]